MISICKKYIELWALLGLIIFILGFFIVPTSSKHNTIFYLTVCVPIALLIPFYYHKLKITSWLTVCILAFSFYLFVNSFWSIHYSTEQSLRYLRYLLTIYCLFAAIFLFHKKHNDKTTLLLNLLLISGFFSYSYGIVNHFTSNPFPFRIRYDDPIQSAMLAGILLLVSLWFVLNDSFSKKKLLYITASLPFIAVLLLSKSRGPQLAFLFTIPLLVYCHPQHYKKIAITTFIFLSALLIAYFYLDAFKEIFYRKSFVQGNYTSYRFEIWQASLTESFEYFWFGQGASHKPPLTTSSGLQFSHSHNILLSVFRMGGILGVVLFALTLYLYLTTPLKQSYKIDKIWAVWLFYGFLCLCFNGKYPLFRPNASWFAFWIPIAFICTSYSNYLPIKIAKK